MRILYGVTGEGLGHAMRSRVIGEHLRARGHQVKFAASGRAATYLRCTFDDVQTITGLSIEYRHGGVARWRTAARTGRSARPAVREAVALYRRAIAGFQPDACISDFDSFSHVFGLLFDRPVISIDHQHVLDRCRHPRAVRRRLPRDFALSRALVRAKMPGCHHYMVTSFYFPTPSRDRTTLVGPILRPEILALTPGDGDHVLVYQTARCSPAVLAALRALPDIPFRVYHRGGADTVGNVTLSSFDERRFLADLATARAVVCNGGYTLIAEALYLGKPVLSIPVRHQGEQELNAAYLDALGLGRAVRAIEPDAITALLARGGAAPRIAAGNQHALDTLDRLLAEAP